MDKYSGLCSNKWEVYWLTWLPGWYFHYMYTHKGKGIYCLRHEHKLAPKFRGGFDKLDNILEKLWQKHQSKFEVEA